MPKRVAAIVPTKAHGGIAAFFPGAPSNCSLMSAEPDDSSRLGWGASVGAYCRCRDVCNSNRVAIELTATIWDEVMVAEL